MKHAHEKYDITKIPDGEPVFVLRARDALAPAVIRYWVTCLAESTDGNSILSQAKIDEALTHADIMERWYRGRSPVPTSSKGVKNE